MKKLKRLGYIAGAIGVILVLLGVISFENEPTVTNKYVFEDVNKVIIEARYTETRVVTGGEISAAFNSAFDGAYTADRDDGTLNIICSPDVAWYRRLLPWLFDTPSKLTVTIPETLADSVFAKNENGELIQVLPE